MRIAALVRALPLLLVAAAVPALQADVTVRYKTEFKSASGLPGGEQAFAAVAKAIPAESIIRVKGQKAFTTMGGFTAIMDLAKQQLTLLDPAGKRYATVAMKDYADRIKGVMPEIPAEVKAAMAAIKPVIDSKLTGRADTVQGVQVEERQITLAISMPGMGDGPSAEPLMKMVMQVWTAKAGESERLPAMREFAAYSKSSSQIMDPASALKSIFGMIPGVGDAMSKVFEQMDSGNSPMMRMDEALYMGAIPGVPAATAGQPLISIHQEVAELSTAPVEDAVFQIPEGYQAATLDDLFKGMVNSQLNALTGK